MLTIELRREDQPEQRRTHDRRLVVEIGATLVAVAWPAAIAALALALVSSPAQLSPLVLATTRFWDLASFDGQQIGSAAPEVYGG